MKRLFVLLILGSFLLSPAASFGQEVFYGFDTAEDEIVQLNSLTITNIQFGIGGSIALINAQSPGVACLKYFDYRASQGFAYPCPPQTSYQIRVNSNTLLLQRNRASLSIGNFSAGDEINVYGFLNRDGVSMDALIVRNLTKPVSARYIQVNNATVQSDPGDFIPTSFTVTQEHSGSCWDFSTGRSRTIACPLGQEGVMTDPVALYYPRPRSYLIQVNNNTAVLNRNRSSMPISNINPGDRVNIYGLYGANGVINALIVRKISETVPIPPPSDTRSPVITSVSGPSTLNTGQTGTWVISAYDPDSTGGNLTYSVTWGDEGQYPYGYATALSPADFRNMQTGTFTHSYVNAGRYTITFTVRDASGLSAVSTLTVNVGQSGTTAPFINFLSPSNGRVGTSVTIYGSGFLQTGNTVFFGSGAITNVSSSDGRTLTFTVPEYLSPYCPPGNFCAAYVMQVSPGQYQVSVGNSLGQSNSQIFTVQ